MLSWLGLVDEDEEDNSALVPQDNETPSMGPNRNEGRIEVDELRNSIVSLIDSDSHNITFNRGRLGAITYSAVIASYSINFHIEPSPVTEYHVRVFVEPYPPYVLKRRFSAFYFLREQLLRVYDADIVADIPDRRFEFLNFGAPQSIETIRERVLGLNMFLAGLLDQPVLARSTEVMAFFEIAGFLQMRRLALDDEGKVLGGSEDPHHPSTSEVSPEDLRLSMDMHYDHVQTHLQGRFTVPSMVTCVADHHDIESQGPLVPKARLPVVVSAIPHRAAVQEISEDESSQSPHIPSRKPTLEEIGLDDFDRAMMTPFSYSIDAVQRICEKRLQRRLMARVLAQWRCRVLDSRHVSIATNKIRALTRAHALTAAMKSLRWGVAGSVASDRKATTFASRRGRRILSTVFRGWLHSSQPSVSDAFVANWRARALCRRVLRLWFQSVRDSQSRRAVAEQYFNLSARKNSVQCSEIFRTWREWCRQVSLHRRFLHRTVRSAFSGFLPRTCAPSLHDMTCAWRECVKQTVRHRRAFLRTLTSNLSCVHSHPFLLSPVTTSPASAARFICLIAVSTWREFALARRARQRQLAALLRPYSCGPELQPQDLLHMFFGSWAQATSLATEGSNRRESIARRILGRTCTSRIFSHWVGYVKSLRQDVIRFRVRCNVKLVRQVWGDWQVWIEERKAKRQRALTVMRRIHGGLRSRCFCAWVSVIAATQDAVEMLKRRSEVRLRTRVLRALSCHAGFSSSYPLRTAHTAHTGSLSEARTRAAALLLSRRSLRRVLCAWARVCEANARVREHALVCWGPAVEKRRLSVMTARCVAAWVEYVADKRRNRTRTAHVRGRLLRLRLRLVMSHWRGGTVRESSVRVLHEAAKWRVRSMTMSFFVAWRNAALAGKEQKLLVARVRHFLWRRLFATSFYGWRDYTVKQKTFETVARAMMNRLGDRRKVAAFDAWISYYESKRASRQQCQFVRRRLEVRRARVLLRTWHNECRKEKDEKQLLEAVQWRMRNRRCNMVFQVWQNFVRVRCGLRQAGVALTRRITTLRLRAAFLGWRSVATGDALASFAVSSTDLSGGVRGARPRHGVAAAALCLLVGQCERARRLSKLQQAMDGWMWFIALRRRRGWLERMARRHAARLYLFQAFARWKTFSATSKEEKFLARSVILRIAQMKLMTSFQAWRDVVVEDRMRRKRAERVYDKLQWWRLRRILLAWFHSCVLNIHRSRRLVAESEASRLSEKLATAAASIRKLQQAQPADRRKGSAGQDEILLSDVVAKGHRRSRGLSDSRSSLVDTQSRDGDADSRALSSSTEEPALPRTRRVMSLFSTTSLNTIRDVRAARLELSRSKDKVEAGKTLLYMLYQHLSSLQRDFEEMKSYRRPTATVRAVWIATLVLLNKIKPTMATDDRNVEWSRLRSLMVLKPFSQSIYVNLREFDATLPSEVRAEHKYSVIQQLLLEIDETSAVTTSLALVMLYTFIRVAQDTRLAAIHHPNVANGTGTESPRARADSSHQGFGNEADEGGDPETASPRSLSASPTSWQDPDSARRSFASSEATPRPFPELIDDATYSPLESYLSILDGARSDSPPSTPSRRRTTLRKSDSDNSLLSPRNSISGRESPQVEVGLRDTKLTE
eukprot:Rmarinus@m.14189